ncbi:MAG: hypothetical protein HKN47_03905 [Pirellulaceae bacterium]|nr:hypothetical protein [Pirellulaceae bacterium]
MNPIANGLSPLMFDAVGASQLGNAAGAQQIEAVGVEFESVFLSMMMKEMRNSLEGGGFFGEESSDTYGGMFDLFIGKHLAASKPLGISDMLLEQYKKSQLSAELDGSQPPISGGSSATTSVTA